MLPHDELHYVVKDRVKERLEYFAYGMIIGGTVGTLLGMFLVLYAARP